MPAILIRNLIPRDRLGVPMLLAGVVASVALVGLVACCEGAAANGVHFDPDSPAGKEYALPLDQARNETQGGESPAGVGSDEESGESAPLFGEGVAGSGPTAGHQGVDGSAGRGAGNASPQAKPAQPEPDGHAGTAALGALDAGDGYSVTTGAGLVAAILIVGGAFGLGLWGLQRTRSA